MKSILSLAAAVALSGLAFAQSTTAPAVAVPASRCPEFNAPPTLPTEPRNGTQLNAGTEAYNTWRTSNNPIEECRRAEFAELQAQQAAINAQINARMTEFNTANANTRALTEQWQAVVDSFNSRQPARTGSTGRQNR